MTLMTDPVSFMRFSGYKNLVPPQIIAQCFINSLAGNGFTSLALDVDFEGWQLRARTILRKAALDHPRPDRD